MRKLKKVAAYLMAVALMAGSINLTDLKSNAEEATDVVEEATMTDAEEETAVEETAELQSDNTEDVIAAEESVQDAQPMQNYSLRVNLKTSDKIQSGAKATFDVTVTNETEETLTLDQVNAYQFGDGEEGEQLYYQSLTQTLKSGESTTFTIAFTVNSGWTDEGSSLSVDVFAVNSSRNMYYNYCGYDNTLGAMPAQDMQEFDLKYTIEPVGNLTPGETAQFKFTVTNTCDYAIVPDTISMYLDPAINNQNDTDIYVPCVVKNSEGKTVSASYEGNSSDYSRWYDNSFYWLQPGATTTYTVECTVPEDWTSGGAIGVISQWSNGDDDGAVLAYSWAQQEFDYDTYVTKKVLVTKESGAPDTALSTASRKDLLSGTFTSEELESGKNLEADLVVKAVADSSITETDMTAIKTAVGDKTLAMTFDLSILKKIDGETIGNVTNLTTPITVTITIPEEYRASDRQYSIIRLHDGVATELSDLDSDPNTVTFETDKFSLYSLVYKTTATSVTPKATTTTTNNAVQTGDAAMPVAALILGSISLALILVLKKKNA